MTIYIQMEIVIFLVKVVPDKVLKDLFKERDALLEEKEN